MDVAARKYVLNARARAMDDTRSRILMAAKEALFTLPFDEVTLPGVAAAARVSTQTVRNHFASKEGLLGAVADSVADELGERRRVAAPYDARSAATMLVAEYETYGQAASRLLSGTERYPALAAMAERGRKEHRQWLEATFGSRCPARPVARQRALAALYAATDVGTWRLLRVDLGYSPAMTTEVMRILIDGALTAG